MMTFCFSITDFILVSFGWFSCSSIFRSTFDVEADFDDILAARCDLLAQGKIDEARPDEPEIVEEE